MPIASASNVYFFYEVPVTLRERTRLKSFIKTLFLREKTLLNTLNYIFCSDERLLEINQQYLKHDYYTDIITFDLSQPGEATNGEIYISIDRVKDNTELSGETFTTELHRVIFHGVFHLCGYKDKTAKDTKVMRAKEDEALRLYFRKA